jgi:hypothetical protein
MGLTRGSLTLPRMNAHRLVIVAAALTTVVAAALATALAHVVVTTTWFALAVWRAGGRRGGVG